MVDGKIGTKSIIFMQWKWNRTAAFGFFKAWFEDSFIITKERQALW